MDLFVFYFKYFFFPFYFERRLINSRNEGNNFKSKMENVIGGSSNGKKGRTKVFPDISSRLEIFNNIVEGPFIAFSCYFYLQPCPGS